MKKILAVVLLLALPSLASAQAFRVGSGVQLVPRLTAPTKITTNGAVWLNTTTNALQYTNPAGATITLGSGGGAAYSLVQQGGTGLTARTTLNFTGAGVSCVDNAGLTRTDCTVAGGSATTIAAGQVAYATATNTVGGDANLTYNSTTQQLSIASTLAVNTVVAQAGMFLFYKSNAPDSATIPAHIFDTSTTWATAGARLFTVRNNTVEKFSVTYGGTLRLASTTETPLVAGAIAWDGTNFKYSTTGASWTNFATGGGTGNYTFSANTADLTASGAMIIGSTNTTGITLGGTGSSGVTMNSGGFAMTFSPGNSGTINTTGVVLNLFANNVSTGWNINGSSGIITGFFGGSSIFQFDGGVGFYAAIDLNRSIGSSTKRWTQAWARQYAGVEQTVAAAATITVDPASGESIRVALGATAITAINGAAGFPGETIRVHFIQDATGTRTYAGFSVAANGFKLAAVVPTTTGYAAAKRDTYTFVWDSVAAFWIETGRTTNF